MTNKDKSKTIVNLKKGSEYNELSHLVYWNDKFIDASTFYILKDFKNFLYISFKALGLETPTKIQYDVADYLQGNINYVDLSKTDIPVEDIAGIDNGDGRIVLAYRGFGKSWITSIYCVWRLLRCPSMEITVVAGTETKSMAFMSFSLSMIKLLPFCHHLVPKKGNVNNKSMFDTPLHKPSQSNSLCSAAIGGSVMTGRRSDIIIGDDLELPNNSRSLMLRKQLSKRVAEFEAVIGSVDGDPKTIFKQKLLLGTPQTQETLYMSLTKTNGYQARVWPARYPNEEQFNKMSHVLCPKIKSDCINGLVETSGHGIRNNMGEVTDTRFSDKDLLNKELGYGHSGFQLQYQLDPSLSDASKFPLKLGDLIVADLNKDLGYNMMIWSSNKDDIINDVPDYGFEGDYFKKPSHIDTKMLKFEDAVLCIDPSSGGGGKDETTYCVAKTVNGYIYIFEVGGFLDGPQSQQTMDDIAALCKKYTIPTVLIESNQGLGMFDVLLRPALIRAKLNHVSIEGYRAVGMKEKRMIDTLEPVMNSHRLVFDRSFVATEKLPKLDGVEDDILMQYSVFYQMSRLENQKNCLPKDDRIDVLHMAVQHFRDAIEVDVDDEVQKKYDEMVDIIRNAPTIFENNNGYSIFKKLQSGSVVDYSDYYEGSNRSVDVLNLDDY